LSSIFHTARIRRPSRSHLSLPVQGELFPEEQVLGGQGGPGPEAGPQEPPALRPEPGHYPAEVKQQRNMSHEDARLPCLRLDLQPRAEFQGQTGEFISMECTTDGVLADNLVRRARLRGRLVLGVGRMPRTVVFGWSSSIH
jgi:hypothetical protein